MDFEPSVSMLLQRILNQLGHPCHVFRVSIAHRRVVIKAFRYLDGGIDSDLFTNNRKALIALGAGRGPLACLPYISIRKQRFIAQSLRIISLLNKAVREGGFIKGVITLLLLVVTSAQAEVIRYTSHRGSRVDAKFSARSLRK
jgi:hypothetical protein